MTEYISKDNDLVRIILSLHQLIGGSIGLYLILIEPSVVIILRILIIILFFYSIFAGFKYIISKENLLFTKLNYLLQIIVFQIYDVMAFHYFLPFSFSLSFDLNTLNILFSFYLIPSITIDFLYVGNSAIGANILSLFIFLFLSSDSGVNREILDYDI